MPDIHLGNTVGHHYDIVRWAVKKVKYKIRNNLLFDNHSEMFYNIYEIYPEFLPSPGQCVVDVGCQYADYAILCNKIYGAEVIAFEPLIVNFHKAMKSIKVNKANVLLYNVGLSNREFTTTMRHDESMLNVIENGSNEERISFQTLDHYELKPDILKIDVEGFEMDVLEGALNTITKHMPRIIIETHSNQLELRVRDFLGKIGYGSPREGRRIEGTGWMDSIVNLFFKY